MPGLSQLELDALCVNEEAHCEVPPSPFGSALLARKRQRHLSAALGLVAPAPLGEVLEKLRESQETGLSQASLDELVVEAPPAEEGVDSSPIGAALRRMKNRRRWGAAAQPPLGSGWVAEEEQKVAEAAKPTSSGWFGEGEDDAEIIRESSRTPFADTLAAPPGGLAREQLQTKVTVTAPEKATSSPQLRVPSSWGYGGLTQAELDTMCGDEPVANTLQPPSPNSPMQSPTRNSPTMSPTKSPMQNSSMQNSPSRNSPVLTYKTLSQQSSPKGSPNLGRRRRSRKADMENSPVGKITPAVSPGKVKEMDSPGPLKSMSPWGSPQRRFGSDPLSSMTATWPLASAPFRLSR